MNIQKRRKMRMKMKIIGALLFSMLIVGGNMTGAPRAEASPDEFGLQSFEEAARADLRAKRAKLIQKVMQLSEKEGEAFWPIFRDYERDLMKVNDEKLNILKEYTRNFANLTEEKAYELAERTLDYEAGRIKLKREYFKRFSKVLSPKNAAKFFQVENQFQMLIDLQISAEIPLVK
jgi:hypothetical protein